MNKMAGFANLKLIGYLEEDERLTLQEVEQAEAWR
jgi:hypothetical protein